MEHDFTLPGGRLVAPATYTMTGVKRVSVRKGFTEYDEWRDVPGVGGGLVASSEGYCLDAPDQMASGASKGHIGRRWCTAGPIALFVNPTYHARG